VAEEEYPSDGTTSGYRRRFSDDQWHAPYVYRSGASIMPLPLTRNPFAIAEFLLVKANRNWLTCCHITDDL